MYTETMLLPALPQLIHEFNLSYNTSSWILSAYLVAGAVMTPVSGKLSDVYGKKKIMIILISIYTVGLIISPFSSNFFMLLISRILQGIGISVFPVTFGLVREQFPRNKLAVSQGIIHLHVCWWRCTWTCDWRDYRTILWVETDIFFNYPNSLILIFIILKFIPKEKDIHEISNTKMRDRSKNLI